MHVESFARIIKEDRQNCQNAKIKCSEAIEEERENHEKNSQINY